MILFYKKMSRMHECTWKLHDEMNYIDKLTLILSFKYIERDNDYTFMV